MRGQPWIEIADALNYTEKWAQEKGGKVLRDVALMLFGEEVETCAVEIDFVKRLFKLSPIVYNKLTLWVNLLRAAAWRFPSKRIN
jgi:hypothetical protein